MTDEPRPITLYASLAGYDRAIEQIRRWRDEFPH